MTIKINLLSKKQRVDVKNFLAVVVAVIVTGLALILWHLVLQQKIAIAIKYKGYWQREFNALVMPSKNNLYPRDGQRIEQQVQSYLMSLEKKRSKVVQIFSAVHQGVVKNLYFTQIEIKNSEVKIVGQVRSMFDLKQLIIEFAQVKYGGKIPLIRRIIKQSDGYNFELLW